jgi:hypothetical protein
LKEWGEESVEYRQEVDSWVAERELVREIR